MNITKNNYSEIQKALVIMFKASDTYKIADKEKRKNLIKGHIMTITALAGLVGELPANIKGFLENNKPEIKIIFDEKEWDAPKNKEICENKI